MQAGGSSKAEIERAVMSAVDFGDSADDFMYVAQYMARIGLEARALKVFRQVAVLEPLRPEPYLYGLQLAQRLERPGRDPVVEPGDSEAGLAEGQSKRSCRALRARRPRPWHSSRPKSAATKPTSFRPSSTRPRSATAWSRSPGPATPTSTCWSKSRRARSARSAIRAPPAAA